MTKTVKYLTSTSIAALMALPLTAIPASAQVDELVVTARKREESIQDIPVSVSAYDSNALARLGVSNVNELSRLVPGFQLELSNARDFERPVIRGQGSILGESGVSFFINDVFFTGSLSSIDLSEVERIEVIKGPQSALYGRNTYSGAINVITKRPGEEFQVNAKAEFAEFGQYDLSAGVSGPLLKGVLGAGIFVRHYERDGEHTNLFDGRKVGGEETDSISAVINFTPTDNLEITARGVLQSDRDDSPAVILQPASLNNVFERGYYEGELLPRSVNFDDRRQLAPGGTTVGLEKERVEGSLKIEWEATDTITVTSITGASHIDSDNRNDIEYLPTNFQTRRNIDTGIPGITINPVGGGVYAVGVSPFFPFVTAFDATLDAAESEDTVSQEVRIEWVPNERFNFLVGALYFRNEDAEQDRRNFNLQPGVNALGFDSVNAQAEEVCAATPGCTSVVDLVPGPPPGIFEPFFGAGTPFLADSAITKNWGVFGRAEYALLDNLRASAEVRYQEETVIEEAGTLTTPLTEISRETFEALLPRFTVDYNLTEDTLLYVVAAKGTKPGGVNGGTARAAGFPSFGEETAWQVEAGTKNVLMDGQLVLNLAGYWTRITGYQLTQNVVTPAGAVTSATINEGTARILGAEFEATYRPEFLEGLTLTTNYAFSDPEFVDGTDFEQAILDDLGDNGIVDGSVSGITSGRVNPTSIEGQQVPRTSKHQFFLGADYVGPAFGDFEWFAGANLTYSSKRFAQVHNLAEFGEATEVYAQFGIQTENFSITAWGKNLTDEDSLTDAIRYRDFDVRNPVPVAAGIGGVSSLARGFQGRLRNGRQFGVTLRANF